MHFLSDLNGTTVLLTGLSILFVCVFLRLLWGTYGNRWPKDDVWVLGLLLGVAFLCFLNVRDAYCPDADQPHIQRSGAINRFKPYTYAVPSGRHSTVTRTGLLVCVGPYDHDVPLMEFDAAIMASVAHRDFPGGVTVTYLGRKEPADVGNEYAITAHPVVEIDDAATGARIFYIDTTRHWPRVIMLVADGLVCVLVFILCLARTRSGTAEDDGTNSGSEGDQSVPSDLTGLGLEGEGRDKS
jgi:hypothetical protein